MTPTRCATYARFFSERQSPLSIQDQIRKYKEYAERQGWFLLDAQVYTDEAISGTTDNRPGLRALLAAVKAKPRPFDVLLVDDSSRLSRNQRQALEISEHLKFAGVRLIPVSQGIDSDSPQAEFLLGIHGAVDQLYVTELGKKVYRGVEGRALQGLHMGDRCFGYRNEPIEDATQRDQYGRSKLNGARLVVEPRQAEVVRLIFQLYARGFSLKRIAKKLNADGIESPQPQAGRISRSWCPSSIRVILRNDRYRGIVFWGRTKKKREPTSGKRRNERFPPTQWRMLEIPEQRIVSEELWDRVQLRLERVKAVFGDAGRKAGLLRAVASNSPYLFSGMLKCGVCGANFTIVSGRGRNHLYAHYGCPQNAFRGETVCANKLRIRRDDLEKALLDGL